MRRSKGLNWKVGSKEWLTEIVNIHVVCKLCERIPSDPEL